MNEFDEKLALYQLILEIEDWLGIKHNPQILKEVWDTMNDYYCDLQQMREDIVSSELEEDDEASSIVDSENIDEAEKKRQIEEAYKELEEIRKKETEEESDFFEEDDESDDYEEEYVFEEQKPKKTSGNKISIVIKEGSTIIKETSDIIQSEGKEFGIYDIHYYQKGGFYVYQEYILFFQKVFLIDDIKSITFDKSKDQVKVAFRNYQRLSPNSDIKFDEMIFYERYENVCIDLSFGGLVLLKEESLFDRAGAGLGLSNLFEGFRSLANLEEGCAVLMVNGNSFTSEDPHLWYHYDESATKNFRQLSKHYTFV